MPKLLLKILNGLHSGSEVMLDDGAYSIGSSNEDDIQFKDASLNSGHAFLKIGEGRAEIKASSGNILFANGHVCEAGDEKWTPINPLQVLTIGTTRIAFGPIGANWNTISEDESFRRDVQFGAPSKDRWGGQSKSANLDRNPSLQLAGVLSKGLSDLIQNSGAKFKVIIIAVVISLVAYTALNLGIFGSKDPGPRDFAKELEIVETAIASLPFSGKIKVTQEADGQIFVRGIIEDNAERRAVVNSLESTHVPVKMRLATSQSIMMDVSNLIQAENVQLKANLQGDGTLVLTGTILNPEKAKRISDLIVEQVSGPTAFNKTGIKDGNDILRDVSRAAKLAEIGTSVTFALVDNRMIEATGTLPYARANSWINFLQNYSENFSERVPLRSLVQVIIPEGNSQSTDRMSSQPIILGAPAKKDERTLDMDKLASGALTVGDVFVANSQKDNVTPKDDGQNAKVASGQTSGAGNAAQSQSNSTGDKQDGTDAAATTAAPDRTPANALNGQNSGADNTVRPQTNTSLNKQDGQGAAVRNSADEPIPPTTRDKLISANELKALIAPINEQNTTTPENSGASSTPSGNSNVAGSTEKTGSELNAKIPVNGQTAVAQGNSSTPTGSVSDTPVTEPSGSTDKNRTKLFVNGSPISASGFTAKELLPDPHVLIDRWISNSLPALDGGKEQSLENALDALGRQIGTNQSNTQSDIARSQSELARATRDLLSRDLRFKVRNDSNCQADWLRDPKLLSYVIFWLDLLSFSDSLSLTSFDKPAQVRLAQAMLNPYALRHCLGLIEPQALPSYFERSAFIPEIITNPAFIKYLARDVTNTSFSAVGANLTGQRYVISSDKKRYRNGSSIDLYSKVLDIGELGIVIELSDRIEVVPFDRKLSWAIRHMPEIGN